jgi:cytosine/adenosine deaminase-related metal-dependent hydrolase
MSMRFLVGGPGVLVLAACGAAAGFGTGEAAAPAVRAVSSEGSALVLRGRVIDGTGAPPIEDGVVVVVGARVACVGPAGQCWVPPDARLVEAEGGTILPGLIDLHVHSRPHYLGWFLAAGVTTIRDANNSLGMIETLLAAEPHRPRILWTGPMLDGPRTVMRFFGEEGVLRPTAEDLSEAFTLEVTTVEEAQAAVDSLAARGAAFVKLYEQLPLEVFRAATDRARQRGVRVMTDLGMHGTRGLTGAEVDAVQALAAGVHSIEHASGYALAYQRLGGDPGRTPFDPVLIDSLARTTVRAGAAVVPTLSVFYAYSEAVTDVSDLPIGERFDLLPAEMREFFEQGAARSTPEGRERSRLGYLLAVEVARRVHELGGTVGAGSDAPAGVFNLPGGSIHRELELLVRAGLTPLEAIRSATGVAGEILGRTDLGVLRPGAAADLLVVAGNPAEDILATRRIRHVIQAGRPLALDLLLP